MRERLKDSYLQTKAGSRLKPLHVHPTIPTLIYVETECGFQTFVARDGLVENEALLKLYMQDGQTQPKEVSRAANPDSLGSPEAPR